MSKYSINISDPAKQDVIDIARYITAELTAPDAASNMVDTLEASMESLGENPNRHNEL